MVDVDFLREVEGFSTKGTVPHPEGSKSGVTVGMGVDLGHTNISRLNLPDALYAKLKPYEGLKSKQAVEFLKKNPLELTEEEAMLITQKSLLRHSTFIKNMWNSHTSIKWSALPDRFQTIVFSVLYQYGTHLRVPKFWRAATTLDVKGMVAELRNFGDAYPTRRNKEADYLEKLLENSDELIG